MASFYFNCEDYPTPTVRGVDEDNFDEETAARALGDAGELKWLGTDEEGIINVLGKLNWSQRSRVIDRYQTLLGNSLYDAMKDELENENFERTVLALLTEPSLYMAKELKEAMKGIGTDERALVEIMCTQTNDEMQHIKEVYEKENGCTLEDDLEGDTSDEFRRIMKSLVCANREQNDCCYEADTLEHDVDLLKRASEGFGTDEISYIGIFCSRSYLQLRVTFKAFEEATGTNILENIESEFSGSVKDALLAIAEFAMNPPTFYAKRLHNAMSGAGTYDRDLTRIIVSRAEIDLGDIARVYNELYETPLDEDVIGDTSGNFRDLLLTLLGKPVSE